MKIAVIAPEVPKNIKKLINVNEYMIYACDSAVHDLLKQEISIDLAIGDFDSLKNVELLKGIKTIKLNKEKDFSDTSYAVNHAYNYTKDVVLLGGIKGTRSDHLIANILLLNQFNNLIIMDETNKIYLLNKGNHIINKNNYKYLSIFPVNETTITLKNTKFILEEKNLKAGDPLGLSNEIIGDDAVVEVISGRVLVIQSK